MKRCSGNRGRVSSSSRNGIERLSRRNAWCSRRRQYFVRLRGTLAKMRFVSEQVAVEDIGGTWGTVARAFPEDVFFNAAKHAASKPDRAFALEISSRINWKFC